MNMQNPSAEQLKCPRCESSNTKFCYYNNYNLSQPRHFCKACRRYWTRGGTLRNVPVGGACRKTPKRPSNPDPDPTRIHKARRTGSPDPNQMETGVAAGLLAAATGGGFGGLVDGLDPDGPGPRAAQLEGFGSGSGLDLGRGEGSGGYLLQSGESGFGEWPDIDIYSHG